LDEKLTWSTHIQIIANKIAKNIGVITRISQVISPKLRLNLYHIMVSPYMTYGNIVWASNYQSRIHSFTTLQKRILRIIGGDNPRTTTTSRFQETKIMRFHNLNMYFTGIFE